ncbi:MAG: hypothetical protein AAGC63_02725 [Propionicimonas sp.]|nr:hypothetical protein [Propionicimonas sp.]
MPTRRPWRQRSGLQRAVTAVAIVSVLGLVAIGGVVWWATYNKVPLPIADRCVATAGGRSTTISPEQAYYAALISGVSVKRGLEPRAASIALATAYQESGIRNLDYGHSDSLGLFQQRPSQGWGTEEEIMDPWYSATQFYKALVKVEGWADGDINDVAQAVQRSAHPEAYRKHVDNARTLASALTGQTPAAFSCTIRSPGAADPDGMAGYLKQTFGKTVQVERDGDGVTVEAEDAATAWSVAQVAVAGTERYGLDSVAVGKWTWRHDPWGLAGWHGPGTAAGPTRVTLVFTG